MQVKAKRKRIERPWPNDPAPDVVVRFNPDAPPGPDPTAVGRAADRGPGINVPVA